MAGAAAAAACRPFSPIWYRRLTPLWRVCSRACRACVRPQKKLDGGHYGDLDTFANDLRLIWNNCYTYNKDPNSDVCVMARELEKFAEDRLMRIPDEIEEKRTEKKEQQSDSLKDMQKQFKQQQKLMMQMQQTLLQQQVSTPAAAGARARCGKTVT